MDIQHIIDTAKEMLLKDGEHAPMLFVESEDGGYSLMYFAGLPATTKEKQYAFFGLGRKYAKECKEKVAHLYFVVEAWMSRDRKCSRPSEDPNRKEGLIILHLDVATAKSTLDRVEMLRDGSGALVNLLQLGKMDGVEDHLLPYFLAGVASAKMSDAELARKLTGQR